MGLTVVQALSVEFLNAAKASFIQILGGIHCSLAVTAEEGHEEGEEMYTRHLLSTYIEVDFSLMVKNSTVEKNVSAIINKSFEDGEFLLILSNKTGLSLTGLAADLGTKKSLSPSASPMHPSPPSAPGILLFNTVIYSSECTSICTASCIAHNHSPFSAWKMENGSPADMTI